MYATRMFLRMSYDPVFGLSILLASLGMAGGVQALRAEPSPLVSSTPIPAPALQYSPTSSAELKEVGRASDGMFYLEASANGRTIRLLVDTGASVTVLTPQDALRLGVEIVPSGDLRVIKTASGRTAGNSAWIDELKVGSNNLGKIPVVVLDTGVGASLIGQDILSKIGPITFDGDRMTVPS